MHHRQAVGLAPAPPHSQALKIQAPTTQALKTLLQTQVQVIQTQVNLSYIQKLLYSNIYNNPAENTPVPDPMALSSDILIGSIRGKIFRSNETPTSSNYKGKIT